MSLSIQRRGMWAARVVWDATDGPGLRSQQLSVPADNFRLVNHFYCHVLCLLTSSKQINTQHLIVRRLTLILRNKKEILNLKICCELVGSCQAAGHWESGVSCNLHWKQLSPQWSSVQGLGAAAGTLDTFLCSQLCLSDGQVGTILKLFCQHIISARIRGGAWNN